MVRNFKLHSPIDFYAFNFKVGLGPGPGLLLGPDLVMAQNRSRSFIIFCDRIRHFRHNIRNVYAYIA
jgi:hypothetical protein